MSRPPVSGRVTVLTDGRAATIENGHVRDGDLWLSPADLASATRWEIKPEGVCRDEVCIPLPSGEAEALVWEGHGEMWFNLSGFARHLDQTIVHDAAHNAWSFGPASFEWQQRLAFQMAPDFTLPDFSGKPHRLSDYRGKKVFLVTWASW